MKISVNWLKKFANIEDVSLFDLRERIGARLVEIEEVQDLAKKYGDVVVAKVISCIPHPDSDHMHVLQLDDNGVADEIISRNIAAGHAKEKAKIVRNENNLVQVVCGAPNVREGMIVAWLPPTSVVPDTFGSDSEFRLDARKLRGVLSYGMCAAPEELDLWDDNDGIMDLTNFAKIGDNFAKIMELDDMVLDIENKSLTHRPDTFGVLGFAREVAAIFGQKSVDPDWFNIQNIDQNKDNFSIEKPKVVIEDYELCSRYEGVVITGADGKSESDFSRKSYLARSGMRPISAIVDISNYLMLLTGQPLHMFDYDKLCKVSPTGKAEIIVRAAKNDEKMTLLDGREIKMSIKDIVIAAGNSENSVAIALAGAMGGASTEIDVNTKNIFIESATFNLFNLRGTQFRHGIFSEAITRFTKGQPAALTDPVLRRAITEFAKIGGVQSSEIVDNSANYSKNCPIKISQKQVNDLLGSNYSISEIRNVLLNLGYKINGGDTEIEAIAPWWRSDIHIIEDIIEDIGRILGFDNIPLDLPSRKFTAVANPEVYNMQRKIREILKSFGANELLTYSFISRKLVDNLGFDANDMYKITNAISPDLQLVRSSLLPKILEKANENIRAGYMEIALFELGQVFAKSNGLTEEKVPKISNKLSLVVSKKNAKDETAFYLAKKILTEMFLSIGIENLKFRENVDFSAPYESKRSAEVFVDDRKIGYLGEMKNVFREKCKLPEFTAMFELSVDELVKIANKEENNYHLVPKFQGTSRDITFQAPIDLEFSKVEKEISDALNSLSDNYVTKLKPIDIFSIDEHTKNITFRIDFSDMEKTIDVKIVSNFIEKISKEMMKKFDAKMI